MEGFQPGEIPVGGWSTVKRVQKLSACADFGDSARWQWQVISGQAGSEGCMQG